MKWNSRLKFSYSFADVIYNLIWPFKCLKMKCWNRINNLNKRYQLYLKGNRKFTKELSVVSFIKMQHKLKIVMRLLMTRNQRLFVSYSKLNKISVISDDSYSESLANLHLPNMLDNNKVKQEHSKVVDKIFDEYMLQKHTLNDSKILHGVYSNKELAEIQDI